MTGVTIYALLVLSAIGLVVSGLLPPRPARYRDLLVGDGYWTAPEAPDRFVLRAAAAMTNSMAFVLLATLGSSSVAPLGVTVAIVQAANAGFNFANAHRPPSVVLRPDGVTVRQVGGSRSVGWESIVADRDALARAGLRGLTDSAVFGGLVSLRRLDVDPQRVADVIAYYRDHPGDRAEIGATPRRVPAVA